MPGLITHWKVFRDAAAMAASGESAEAKAIRAALGREPLASIPNGAAPGREKDLPTGYYGGADGWSAFAWLGAHAPSFFWFGVLRERPAETAAVLERAFDRAARDLPERRALAGEGFRIAPYIVAPPAGRLWVEGGIRPTSFTRSLAGDLFHSNKAGSLVVNLLALARTLGRRGDLEDSGRVLAFALGHLAHAAADLVLHPLVGSLAGIGRDPAVDNVRDDGRLTAVLCDLHRWIELHQDAFVSLACFGRSPFRARWAAPLDALDRAERLGELERPADAFLRDFIAPAFDATYESGAVRSDRAGASGGAELAQGLAFYRKVMIERAYRSPDGVLPATPLMPLVAPNFRARVDSSVNQAIQDAGRKRDEIGAAAREYGAERAKPVPQKPEEREQRAKKLDDLAKKVVEKEKAFIADVVLGEGADAFLERLSLAAKLGASLMRRAAAFYEKGDEAALKAFQNWSLDTGYRIEPEWDDKAAKGSFPLLRLKMRHVLNDLAEKRVLDADGCGPAPKEEGKTWRVEVRHDLDDPRTADDRLILTGDGGGYTQLASLSADARRLAGDRLEVSFTGVKAGQKYSLEIDDMAGGRYYVFRDRGIDAKELE